MRHATCSPFLLALAATAGATSGPGVLITRTTLDGQAHTIRADVVNCGGEKVFAVTVALTGLAWSAATM